MRFKPRRPQLRDTVLLTGWLFADLFLALVVIFLVADPRGVAVATPTSTPTPVPTATPVPTPSPTQVPLPILELNKHRITLTNVDTNGILNDAQDAIDNLKQQIRSQTFLNNRSVGLAIVYGGTPTDAQIGRALNVANKVMDVLRSLGQEGFAFSRSVYYDPLYILGDDTGTIVIDIYLFV